MKETSKPTVILDLSKGLAYDFLYGPFIGKARALPYPQISRLRIGAFPTRRKVLYS